MEDLKGKTRIFIDKNFIETIHMALKPETSNPLLKFSRFLNWGRHLFFVWELIEMAKIILIYSN